MYPNSDSKLRIIRIKNFGIVTGRGVFNYSFTNSSDTVYPIRIDYPDLFEDTFYAGSLSYAVEGKNSSKLLYCRFQQNYADTYLSTPGPSAACNFSIILIGYV